MPAGYTSTRKRRKERGGGGSPQNERRSQPRCNRGLVGVRTLIMGCQTIMLIVYSVRTPAVCLDVCSYQRLQPAADSRVSRYTSSFFVLADKSSQVVWRRNLAKKRGDIGVSYPDGFSKEAFVTRSNFFLFARAINERD